MAGYPQTALLLVRVARDISAEAVSRDVTWLVELTEEDHKQQERHDDGLSHPLGELGCEVDDDGSNNAGEEGDGVVQPCKNRIGLVQDRHFHCVVVVGCPKDDAVGKEAA